MTCRAGSLLQLNISHHQPIFKPNSYATHPSLRLWKTLLSFRNCMFIRSAALAKRVAAFDTADRSALLCASINLPFCSNKQKWLTAVDNSHKSNSFFYFPGFRWLPRQRFVSTRHFRFTHFTSLHSTLPYGVYGVRNYIAVCWYGMAKCECMIIEL